MKIEFCCERMRSAFGDGDMRIPWIGTGDDVAVKHFKLGFRYACPYCGAKIEITVKEGK